MKPARFRARVLALANLLTVLAVLGVWLAAAFAFVPRTSSDKHCPTALVQVVRKPSGAGWESRTPQPSDPEFQPCLCNEKKSAQARPDSGSTVQILLLLPVAVFADAPRFCMVLAIRTAATCWNIDRQLTSRLVAPIVPPPKFS